MIPQQLKTALSLPKILKNAPFYIVNFLLDRNTETEYELRNGLFFKLKSRCDQEILNEVWLHKDYSPAGFKIKPTDIVIDIGAQKGVFSVYAATQASKGKVLSFEPFKENYDLLVWHAQRNNLSNIVPINKAVSRTSGLSILYIDVDNTGGHSQVLPKSIKKTINIETISFPQIIKDHKLDTIDFLKMDCEGAEYEIFKGMKPEHFKKIKKIAMETHEIDEHRNRFVLKALLEKQGFSCQLVNEYLYAKR